MLERVVDERYKGSPLLPELREREGEQAGETRVVGGLVTQVGSAAHCGLDEPVRLVAGG
jgi:hypothetical protein